MALVVVLVSLRHVCARIRDQQFQRKVQRMLFCRKNNTDIIKYSRLLNIILSLLVAICYLLVSMIERIFLVGCRVMWRSLIIGVMHHMILNDKQPKAQPQYKALNIHIIEKNEFFSIKKGVFVFAEKIRLPMQIPHRNDMIL